jgi:hypothetical protein
MLSVFWNLVLNSWNGFLFKKCVHFEVVNRLLRQNGDGFTFFFFDLFSLALRINNQRWKLHSTEVTLLWRISDVWIITTSNIWHFYQEKIQVHLIFLCLFDNGIWQHVMLISLFFFLILGEFERWKEQWFFSFISWLLLLFH